MCDQDDIWNVKKIEYLVKEMEENKYCEKCIPAVLYSDMDLIDENGKRLDKRISEVSNLKFKTKYNIFLKVSVWGTSMIVYGTLCLFTKIYHLDYLMICISVIMLQRLEY